MSSRRFFQVAYKLDEAYYRLDYAQGMLKNALIIYKISAFHTTWINAHDMYKRYINAKKVYRSILKEYTCIRFMIITQQTTINIYDIYNVSTIVKMEQACIKKALVSSDLREASNRLESAQIMLKAAIDIDNNKSNLESWQNIRLAYDDIDMAEKELEYEKALIESKNNTIYEDVEDELDAL